MNPLYIDWGLTHYEDAFKKQLECVQSRIDSKIQDSLILTEHHPVYTLGKRKDSEKNLIWSPQTLQAHGITLAHTNRGGDITHHGPGQLVGYPIINLQKSKDLHQYLRNLEQVLINALQHLGLSTTRNPGKTGIWIDNRKIAAIGVAVKQWVTYHGFALNINNNLEHFDGIVPCGIPSSEATVTSLQKELRCNLDLQKIKNTIALEFWNIFK